MNDQPNSLQPFFIHQTPIPSSYDSNELANQNLCQTIPYQPHTLDVLQPEDNDYHKPIATKISATSSDQLKPHHSLGLRRSCRARKTPKYLQDYYCYQTISSSPTPTSLIESNAKHPTQYPLEHVLNNHKLPSYQQIFLASVSS